MKGRGFQPRHQQQTIKGGNLAAQQTLGVEEVFGSHVPVMPPGRTR